MSKKWFRSVIIASALFTWGCSSGGGGGGGSGGSATGGKSTGSGGSGSGGTSASGGTSSSGGSSATGGTSSSGGTVSSGGSSAAGGSVANGGTTSSGGVAKGGAGGAQTGGTTGGAGGKTGGTGAGGTTAAGGVTGPGGTTAAGGAQTGGTTGAGGGTGSKGDVTVQLDKTKQTIQGFGLNTALFSGTVPISTIYGTTGTDGIGLSILRVGMNTDGSLTGSGISDAKAKNAKIIGSCWSAPANCKSNGRTDQGGYLLESCYESWSTTIANFASQQQLYAMSIANESDFASCKSHGPPCTDDYDTMTYTGKQMVAWVKVAGPKLKAKNVKVIAPEASEWIHAWSNLSATGSTVSGHPESSDPHKCGCYSNVISTANEASCAQTCKDGNGYDYGHWLAKDATAWAAFDILGVHEYDSQIAYAWPADVTGGKRDREVWQTEMSGVMYWPEQGPTKTIDNGLAVAGWIHSALTVGEASAWLYWWYQALYQDDNEGLALLKSDSASATKAKRFYTLGNYSKFVRPGYIAVQAADASSDVLISAYKSADGATVVIVAINKGSGAASPKIGFSGGTAPTSCTPTVTSASDNLKDGTAVTLTDGILTASLASKTVTTYTCK